MENKTKLNIKATIMLIIYISIGFIVARLFQIEAKPKDGFQNILLLIIGFITGIGGSIILTMIWGIIRENLED
jgi:hypothetical protein